MTEFQVIQRYDVPADLPIIVAVSNKTDLQQYEEWCYKYLGTKAGDAPFSAKWFQARGYFFFSNRAVADRFMRGASENGRERVRNMVEQASHRTGLNVNEIQSRLYDAFSTGTAH